MRTEWGWGRGEGARAASCASVLACSFFHSPGFRFPGGCPVPDSALSTLRAAEQAETPHSLMNHSDAGTDGYLGGITNTEWSEEVQLW